MSHLYLNCRSHIGQLRGDRKQVCRRYRTLSERFSTYNGSHGEEDEKYDRRTSLGDVVSVTLCNSRPPDVTVHYGGQIFDLRDTLLRKRRASEVGDWQKGNDPGNGMEEVLHPISVSVVPEPSETEVYLSGDESPVDPSETVVYISGTESHVDDEDNQTLADEIEPERAMYDQEGPISDLSHFESRTSIQEDPVETKEECQYLPLVQTEEFKGTDAVQDDKENKRHDESRRHRHSSSRKHKKHRRSKDKKSEKTDETKMSPLSERLMKINEERKRVEELIMEVKKKRAQTKGEKPCASRKDIVPKLEPKTYHKEDQMFIGCSPSDDYGQKPANPAESDGSSTISYGQDVEREDPSLSGSRTISPDSEKSEAKIQTFLKKCADEAAKEKAKKIEKILQSNVSKPVYQTGDLLGVLMRDMGTEDREAQEKKEKADQDKQNTQNYESFPHAEISLEVVDMDIEENSHSPPRTFVSKGSELYDPFENDAADPLPDQYCGKRFANGQKVPLLPTPEIPFLPTPNIPFRSFQPVSNYTPFQQDACNASFAPQPDSLNIWQRLGPAPPPPPMAPPPLPLAPPSPPTPPQDWSQWAPPLPPEPADDQSDVESESPDHRIIVDSVAQRLEGMQERLPKPDELVSVNALRSAWEGSVPPIRDTEKQSRRRPNEPFGTPPWLRKMHMNKDQRPSEHPRPCPNLKYASPEYNKQQYDERPHRRKHSPDLKRYYSGDQTSRDRAFKKKRHSDQLRHDSDRPPKLPGLVEKATESGFKLFKIDHDTPLVPDTIAARSAHIKKPADTLGSFMNVLSGGQRFANSQHANVIHTLAQLVANHTKKTSTASSTDHTTDTKPTKPDMPGKFHTRTLLKGKGVKPRYIPLDPVYGDKPFNSRGERVQLPSDPRISFYGKKKKRQDLEEDLFVDTLL